MTKSSTPRQQLRTEHEASLLRQVISASGLQVHSPNLALAADAGLAVMATLVVMGVGQPHGTVLAVVFRAAVGRTSSSGGGGAGGAAGMSRAELEREAAKVPVAMVPDILARRQEADVVAGRNQQGTAAAAAAAAGSAAAGAHARAAAGGAGSGQGSMPSTAAGAGAGRAAQAVAGQGAASARPDKLCAQCGQDETDVKYKLCSQCQAVRYCRRPGTAGVPEAALARGSPEGVHACVMRVTPTACLHPRVLHRCISARRGGVCMYKQAGWTKLHGLGYGGVCGLARLWLDSCAHLVLPLDMWCPQTQRLCPHTCICSAGHVVCKQDVWLHACSDGVYGCILQKEG